MRTGEPVRAYAAPSDFDEAAFIVDVVKGLVEDGVSPTEIAVLYRSTRSRAVIEHALFNAAMPYRVYGGMRFFERAEVKQCARLPEARGLARRRWGVPRVVNFPRAASARGRWRRCRSARRARA